MTAVSSLEKFKTGAGFPVYAFRGEGFLRPTTRLGIPEQLDQSLKGLIFISKDRRRSGPMADPSPDEEKLVKVLLGYRAAFCMNPHLFTEASNDRISASTAKLMLKSDKLAQSIERKLSDHGLYDFLERLNRSENAVYHRAYIARLLCSLSFFLNDLHKVEDISIDILKYWLSFFRSPDGMRWRDELWTSHRDYYFQDLKEIVRAFARVLGSSELEALSGQSRTVGGHKGTKTWKAFRAQASGVEAEYLSIYDEWVSDRRVSRGDSQAMLRRVCDWSKEFFPSSTVAEIFTCKEREESFAESIEKARGGSKNTSNIVRLAQEFSDYIEDFLREAGIIDALWPLIAKNALGKAQERDRQKGGGRLPSESRSRPLPPHLFPIVEEILEEGEEGWPGSCSLFYEVYKNSKGQPQRLYSPVLTTYFQILLILPLRGIQLARFDSGEGDTNVFDGENLQWHENSAPAAGFWKRLAKPPVNRGFSRMVGEQTEAVTGIFINTNKTGEPYVIPWEHPKVHRLLWNLRVWQEAHFPTKEPLQPSEYSKGENLNEEHLSRLPEIFPLFRLPGGRREHIPGAPPSYRRRDQVWQEIMLETERRWNERNPLRQIQIVRRQNKTGQPHGALYNLHGLRVAGLTRLFMSGVPLEILSKLVAGHAGLLMTIYYLKFRPCDIHSILQKSVIEAPAISEEFIDGFHHWSLDQAKRQAVSLQDGAIEAAWSQEAAHKLMLADVTIGMCPFAATRCSDGGEPIPGTKNNKGEFRYAPVEGGPKNCIMCRHFISGPPFMLQLWLFGTSLLDRYDQTMELVTELQTKKNDMLAQNPGETRKQRTAHQIQMATLDIQIDAQTSAALLLLKGIHRTWRLLEMSEGIRKSHDDQEGVDLIVQDTSPLVGLIEVSPFERDAILTAGARVFPMLHDGVTQARYEASITKIFHHAGIRPIAYAPLSPEQKRFGHDQAGRLILEKCDRLEVQALEEGRLTLHDVGIAPELERISELALAAPLMANAIEHVPAAAAKASRRASKKK